MRAGVAKYVYMARHSALLDGAEDWERQFSDSKT
jgi:hypothetical protein